MFPAVLIVALAGSVFAIDGDTLAFGRTHVRVANLDSPETGDRARCNLEVERGRAATRYARRLLRGANDVTIYDRDGSDRFGRVRARILIDGQDFGRLMISAGHGRPWRGHTSNWC